MIQMSESYVMTSHIFNEVTVIVWPSQESTYMACVVSLQETWSDHFFMNKIQGKVAKLLPL